MNDMGRKAKMRLDYFPMDVDFFQDLKIRKLIKRQGGKAIAVYTLLLCYIYKNGYYMVWDQDLPFICSEQTGYDEAYVREVIKVCLQLGLFSKDLYDKSGILTSRGIQERYQRICQLTRRTAIVSEYSLLDADEVEEIKQEAQAHATTTEQDIAVPEPPQQKPVAKRTRKTTKKEEPVPQPPKKKETVEESPTLSLDTYIEELDHDTLWLDEIQFLHGMNSDKLREKLGEFRSECIANGKTEHADIQDVKHHFNSWLRIILNKNNNENQNNISRTDKRKGHLLTADGEKAKDYGSSF